MLLGIATYLGNPRNIASGWSAVRLFFIICLENHLLLLLCMIPSSIGDIPWTNFAAGLAPSVVLYMNGFSFEKTPLPILPTTLKPSINTSPFRHTPLLFILLSYILILQKHVPLSKLLTISLPCLIFLRYTLLAETVTGNRSV